MNYVVLFFIVICLLLYGIVFAMDSEKGIASNPAIECSLTQT